MKRCRVCKQCLLSEPNEVCPACFAGLPEVRIFSVCGPCLTGYRLVRWNGKTASVAWQNGSNLVIDRERRGAVHLRACPSCTDHPRSQYRDGYLD